LGKEIMVKRRSFLTELYKILSSDGIVSVNVASPPRVVDSPARQSRVQSLQQNQLLFKEAIAAEGFVKSFVYEESKIGFPQPSRYYALGFKNASTAKKWNRNEAQIEAEINKFLTVNLTPSGQRRLIMFDGATMMTYSKVTINVDEHVLKAAVAEVRKKTAFSAKQSQPYGDQINVKKELNSSTSSRMDDSQSCQKDIPMVEFPPSRAAHVQNS
jgi:hypothetical protein